MSSQKELVAKVLIIGEAKVGKTSILTRYTDGQFLENLMPTLGIDYRIKRVVRNDQEIKLQIWDTAGQERFRSITQNFYKGAMGIILVFDLTDKQSFVSLNNWLSSIQQYSGENVCKLILGNKCDDEQQQVTDQDIQQLEENIKVKCFKTSAKQDIGIQEAFNHITDEIQKRNFQDIGTQSELNMQQMRGRSGTSLQANKGEERKKKKQGGCC